MVFTSDKEDTSFHNYQDSRLPASSEPSSPSTISDVFDSFNDLKETPESMLAPQMNPAPTPARDTMLNHDDIPSFQDDGLSSNPKPEVFMKKSLLFLINTNFDVKTKVQWFGLKMEAGAEEWFKVLSATDKASIDTVQVAFQLAYPKEAEQVLMAGEKWARLLR